MKRGKTFRQQRCHPPPPPCLPVSRSLPLPLLSLFLSCYLYVVAVPGFVLVSVAGMNAHVSPSSHSDRRDNAAALADVDATQPQQQLQHQWALLPSATASGIAAVALQSLLSGFAAVFMELTVRGTSPASAASSPTAAGSQPTALAFTATATTTPAVIAVLAAPRGGTAVNIDTAVVRPVSVWLLNIQLSVCAGVVALASKALSSSSGGTGGGGHGVGSIADRHGWFPGFTLLAWLAVVNFSAGGLLTAVVRDGVVES